MTMVDLKKHGGISKAPSDLQHVPLEPVEHRGDAGNHLR